MRSTSAWTILVLLVPAVGCGGGAGAGETATGADAALEYEGPIEATADPAAGELVFQNMCASCHGPGGTAPDITHERMSPAEARKQVREGDDGMPAFPDSRIDGTDLEHLLAHLASLGIVVTDGAPVAGPTSGDAVEESASADPDAAGVDAADPSAAGAESADVDEEAAALE